MKIATTVLVTLVIVSSVLGGTIQDKWKEIFEKIREMGLLSTSSITSQPATEAEIQELITGNTQFALDLFKAVSTPGQEDNTIFSPYSISAALAMTYAGARGRTALQMRSSLHFTCPNLHGAFKEVNAQLLSNTDSEKGIALKVANSLWGQSDYPMGAAFKDLVKNNYQSEVMKVDFKTNGEGAKKSINQWVDQQTNGKIKELLTKTPNSLTRLILVNAIYFKASWATQFVEYHTKPAEFKLLSGSKTKVNMMRFDEPAELRYLEEKDFVAVGLPYETEKAFMTIILPNEGKFAQVKQSFDANSLKSILQNDKTRDIDFSMPQFKFESKLSLKESLQKLGMTDAFNYGEANFSGMDGTKNLLIKDAIHNAMIEVNEKGTESAAATAVIMSFESFSLDQVTVTVDRPFMFVIHDENGSVLFMGQVTQP